MASAFRRDGVTLMEIIVVLVIVGIAAAFALPNFSAPSEKARTTTAQNNLLAIYSAQQNYNNNYGSYCTVTTGNVIPCGDTLANLNTNLSLNIQDDGTYTYSCVAGASCTATRVGMATTNLVLTLNKVTNLSGVGVANPVCNTANNWCT